jgi:hypothetical protein
MNIEANLKAFLAERTPDGRFASFDYCFNYFQSHREHGTLVTLSDNVNLQVACLQLGFFLASWGMFRRDFLLSRSVKYFAPTIDAISSSSAEIWSIDADCYLDDESLKTLENATNKILESMPHEETQATDTLVTKIMLGVYGCIPAFDSQFKKGLGTGKLGKPALRKISDFYKTNAAIVEQYRVPTLDFNTGKETERRYTRAKVIDMIFFIEGGLIKGKKG